MASPATNYNVSKKGSAIETSSGTLHVQPYRTLKSSGSTQLRAKLTFVPRKSQLEASGEDVFRGFYVLFWICVGLMILRSYVTRFDETGYPLSLSFAALFSKDALSLAISDAVLVCTTAICVPFVKLFVNGTIRYSWTGMIIQHTYQAAMLGIAVHWTFHRHWEWVQSGFFTLHCLVMLMKMHSYISVNGTFSDIFRRKLAFENQLRDLIVTLPGGWAQAEADAKDERTKKQQEEMMRIPHQDPAFLATSNSGMELSTPGSDMTPSGTPQPIENGVVLGTQPIDSDLAVNTLRNRLVAHAQSQSQTVEVISGTPGSIAAAKQSTDQPPTGNAASYFPNSNASDFPAKTIDSDVASPPERHPLMGHPDIRISELAEAIGTMDDELTSPDVNPGKPRVRFPHNVTLWNFFDYQTIPTLVYELEYPRTEKVRISYVFEKTVAFLGTFTLLYTVTEHYIIPLTPRPGQPFFRSMLDLALPFMLSYLLLFYIIFECICNGFAEISRFADRQFYEDWWNSTSWDEFSRKWNKPVHSFLLRHVYASSISYHKLSKPSAALVTFFLSAVLHELVMAIVTKKIRMYLFAMQMAQIPLIALGRLPIIKRNKILGNVVFWAGLMMGFPLLCVAYCAY